VQPGSSKGGDVIIVPGKASPSVPIAQDGSIVFRMADGVEVLRFDPDGKVFVRGHHVDSNELIYAEFRHWLTTVVVSR